MNVVVSGPSASSPNDYSSSSSSSHGGSGSASSSTTSSPWRGGSAQPRSSRPGTPSSTAAQSPNLNGLPSSSAASFSSTSSASFSGLPLSSSGSFNLGAGAGGALSSNQQQLQSGKSSSSSSSPPYLSSAVALYQAPYVTAREYVDLARAGKCQRYSLVRDDSFRTFRSYHDFHKVVPEQSIVRVCNAFDRKFASAKWQYCQGMNVYAGVFLYVMPELDAFNVFSTFCTQYIPLYWKSNHIGVEAGCKLLDRVLFVVDPELYHHLHSREIRLHAILYAFSAIKTMSASAPPLEEALILWDFLLAMGPHMSILCVAAQLYSMREKVRILDKSKAKLVLFFLSLIFLSLFIRYLCSISLSLSLFFPLFSPSLSGPFSCLHRSCPRTFWTTASGPPCARAT